jgi:hypothetical protein
MIYCIYLSFISSHKNAIQSALADILSYRTETFLLGENEKKIEEKADTRMYRQRL